MFIQAHIAVKQRRSSVNALFRALVLDRNNVAVAVRLNAGVRQAPKIYSEQQYIDTLGNGFFMVRFERCTDREKNFMYAMIDCGELPCTISNVAKNMQKQVTQISPIRAQLINKGLIYAAKYGEIVFTVPKFDEFLIRKRG